MTTALSRPPTEITLLRQTGASRVVEVFTPLPDTLTVDGFRYF